MEQSKANKASLFGYAAIKLLIAAVAFIFIYYRVISRDDFSGILSNYKEIFNEQGSRSILISVMLLMLVNWSLEALKWKLMMQKLETIPFARALAAVFSGLTVSFFTPNRIGEYAGRIFHLRSPNRIKGTLVTVFENLSQLIVTIVIGSLSLILFLKDYSGLHEYIVWATGILMIIFSATLLFLFLEVPVLDKSILKMDRLKKLVKYLEVLSEYRKSELLRLLGLAFARYIVFTMQYILLLKMFGIEAPLNSLILMINMIFFVMTLVPTFALTEIGVRGAVATYFLSKVSPDGIAVLDASISLWLINLVIPALLGIIFIFQFRFRSDKP